MRCLSTAWHSYPEIKPLRPFDFIALLLAFFAVWCYVCCLFHCAMTIAKLGTLLHTFTPHCSKNVEKSGPNMCNLITNKQN